MKRVIIILFLIFCIFINHAECKELTDIVGTKYEGAVNNLVKNSILSGYPDNTFKPNKTVTRAEITTVITKLNKLELLTGKVDKFSDISNHWGKDYINTLFEHGFVSGYENGEFKPDNEITCAEVTAMLLNSLGYKEEVSYNGLSWPENYTEKAKELMLYENITISPNSKMNRGDVAIFINNTIKIMSNTKVENESNIIINSDKEKIDKFDEVFVSIENIDSFSNDTEFRIWVNDIESSKNFGFRGLSKGSIIKKNNIKLSEFMADKEDNISGKGIKVIVEILLKDSNDSYSVLESKERDFYWSEERGKDEVIDSDNLELEIIIPEVFNKDDKIKVVANCSPDTRYLLNYDVVCYFSIDDISYIGGSWVGNLFYKDLPIEISIEEFKEAAKMENIEVNGKDIKINAEICHIKKGVLKTSEKTFQLKEQGYEYSENRLNEMLPNFEFISFPSAYIELNTDNFSKYEFSYGKEDSEKNIEPSIWYKATSSQIKVGKNINEISTYATHAYIREIGKKDYYTIRIREEVPNFEIDYKNECINVDDGEYGYGIKYFFNDGSSKREGYYNYKENLTEPVTELDLYTITDKKLDLTKVIDKLRNNSEINKVEIIIWKSFFLRGSKKDEGGKWCLLASYPQTIIVDKSKISMLNSDVIKYRLTINPGNIVYTKSSGTEIELNAPNVVVNFNYGNEQKVETKNANFEKWEIYGNGLFKNKDGNFYVQNEDVRKSPNFTFKFSEWDINMQGWYNVEIPEPSSREGYIFEGWYKEEDIGSKVYGLIKPGIYKFLPSKTTLNLYPKWKEIL